MGICDVGRQQHPAPYKAKLPLTLSDPFETLNVDGGVTNNDPFNYAHDYLLSLPPAQLAPTGAVDTDRAVISIAPFPTTQKYSEQYVAAPFLVGMTAGSPPLPATRPQVEWVADWFQRRGTRTEPLFDEEANPTTLLQGLQHATCFQISCHGEYTQNHPEITGWQIVTTPGETEIVGLDRMYRLDLTDLHHATLISCWGADNFYSQGAGYSACRRYCGGQARGRWRLRCGR